MAQEELAIVNSLRKYSRCNSAGQLFGVHEFGGPCQDPFKGIDSDLAISFGAVDRARFRVSGTFRCGAINSGDFGLCCCECNASGRVKTLIEDKYDFIGTTGAGAGYPAICAAIVEDFSGVTAKTKCELDRRFNQAHRICW
jgi:hypothetical protein